MDKVGRNLISIAITTLIIIFASPYIQSGINTALTNFAGTDIDINRMDPWDPIGPGINRFLQYLIMQVAGREAPIFPMVAYSLVGIMIGYVISLDKPRKDLIKVGFIIIILLIRN